MADAFLIDAVLLTSSAIAEAKFEVVVDATASSRAAWKRLTMIVKDIMCTPMIVAKYLEVRLIEEIDG